MKYYLFIEIILSIFFIENLNLTFCSVLYYGTSSNAHRNNSAPLVVYDLFQCCAEVFGSCRASCENLSLVQLAAADAKGQDNRLGEVKKFCPPIQIEFWDCMHRTLQAVNRGSQWSGRKCCSLGMSARCQNACATSSSREELYYGCRQSDEHQLFACFETQEFGDSCCGNARTSECLQSCRSLFEPHSVRSKGKHKLLKTSCGENNSKVLQCVRNYTDLSPLKNTDRYTPCCDFATEDQCRNTCKETLKSTEYIHDIYDELEAGGCGNPLPTIPFWQCFLSTEQKIFPPSTSNEISQINKIGMDSAKLHCCPKANTPKCRRLCLQTFSNDWTASRSDFEMSCLMQPIELDLRQCMDEVDEPCQLGCDGLSFCTNFNNRPAELFRSCHTSADMAARSDVEMWKQNGYISLPGINLPIKNISRCSPEKWRAVACTLQIKPCTRGSHLNQICREDCYEVLSDCMDWSRVTTSVTAESICSQLSPKEEDIPCISLKPYLEPSDVPSDTGGFHQLTSPCKGYPCNSTQVCLPNRNESIGHQCVPGCTLGEASSYWVPFGAYVRIPISSNQKGCVKICRCGLSGRIEHCQPLPCFTYSACFLANRRIEHSTWVYVECNVCSCFAGEMTCTKKQCKIDGISDDSYTSLPCNCPAHYVPVCGKNGNTYHSACIAKCIGLKDTEIEFGACKMQDPCQIGQFNCPTGTKCIEDRKICLSVMHQPCLQYQCVNTTSNCIESGYQPACDTKRITHSNACNLFKSNANLAHFGSCYKTCSLKGTVCGINGVTYRNECEAWSDYSYSDYEGICKEVGLLSSDMGKRCKNAKCHRMPSTYCQNIIPPGACCPICSGAFRIVYSRKQIDRALYALKGKNTELITLKNVLRELDNLIQISECQLTGFLTMETDIFLAILPRTKTPSEIQIEACTRESQKIATLIESQSHTITTNLVLSALTVANMVMPTIESNAIVAFLPNIFVICISIIIRYI